MRFSEMNRGPEGATVRQTVAPSGPRFDCSNATRGLHPWLLTDAPSGRATVPLRHDRGSTATSTVQNRHVVNVLLGHAARDLPGAQQLPQRLVERDHPLLAAGQDVVVDTLDP